MATLNDSRLTHLGDNDIHIRIFAIETALKRLNEDQGLGFAIAGTVVDKRMVKQLVAGVATVLPPIFATVMALRPADSRAFCALTEAQSVLIQSVLAEFNATCNYNISAGPSGVIQW